jgi:hypothetical protein
MVVNQLLPFPEVAGEVLSWTRPNFFALRYELGSAAGTVLALSVQGIGQSRYVLAESSERAWRFAVFPVDATEVIISQPDDFTEVARYTRTKPARIRLAAGAEFELRFVTAGVQVLEDSTHQALFLMEQVEAFPRWKVDVKLEAEAASRPELPLLAAAAGCALVFN